MWSFAKYSWHRDCHYRRLERRIARILAAGGMIYEKWAGGRYWSLDKHCFIPSCGTPAYIAEHLVSRNRGFGTKLYLAQ
jgi:hypothetical protein